MGTLNKALRCLFEHALGALPKNDSWRDGCEKVYQIVAGAGGGRPEDGLRWKDLYTYFGSVEGGASAKAVDALFRSLDRSGRGTVSRDEFVEVTMQRLSSLRDDKALEERLAARVPRLHVVPGSNKLNSLARTQAFRVQVVTRDWVRSLAATWREMDSDGDGRVSLPDLKRYFARAQPGLVPFIASIFRAIEGEQRSGAITFKQFLKALYPEASRADLRTLTAMSASRAAAAATAAAEAVANDALLAEIASVFTVFDDDKSGELDYDEFTSAMELTGHTKEEAAGMFRVVDSDGSGAVSWDEFRTWYSSHYAHYMEEAQRRMLDETNDEAGGYAEEDEGGG